METSCLAHIFLSHIFTEEGGGGKPAVNISLARHFFDLIPLAIWLGFTTQQLGADCQCAPNYWLITKTQSAQHFPPHNYQFVKFSLYLLDAEGGAFVYPTTLLS